MISCTTIPLGVVPLLATRAIDGECRICTNVPAIIKYPTTRLLAPSLVLFAIGQVVVGLVARVQT